MLENLPSVILWPWASDFKFSVAQFPQPHRVSVRSEKTMCVYKRLEDGLEYWEPSVGFPRFVVLISWCCWPLSFSSVRELGEDCRSFFLNTFPFFLFRTQKELKWVTILKNFSTLRKNVFHYACMRACVDYLIYPFIYPWTPGFLPRLSYCK